MSSILDLVRPDLRTFAGYASARRADVSGSIWLNANESPWPSPADPDGASHRYPEPQPAALRTALAELYGVEADRVLIGRGSDEAIDLLVRALCRPGHDAVAIAPPVFGMYAVSARLQGAPLIECPLRDTAEGFVSDLDALAAAAEHTAARLIFLCSPANPTGQALAPEAVLALCRRVRGRALVVVDEAYGEYSRVASLMPAIAEHDNLAVLRTLSKAHALAAARIGVVIADPRLIAVLRNCQAPYPVPAPSAHLALAALQPEALARTRERVAAARSERDRLTAVLAAEPCLVRVYRSEGNFLLARFRDAEAVFRALLAAGVVVRDMRAHAGLGDALRISIGTPPENDAVIAAIRSVSEAIAAGTSSNPV